MSSTISPNEALALLLALAPSERLDVGQRLIHSALADGATSTDDRLDADESYEDIPDDLITS